MKTSLHSSIHHWFASFLPGAHAPAALREADAHIVSLQRENTFGGGESYVSRFVLDAVIEPTAPDAEWQLDELALLPPQAAELAERGESGDDLCCVLDVQVMEDGHFHPAEDDTCIGPCRVRLRMTVRNGLKLLRFRYRDALFGQVLLPTAEFAGF
jgi:hypothetical protein